MTIAQNIGMSAPPPPILKPSPTYSVSAVASSHPVKVARAPVVDRVFTRVHERHEWKGICWKGQKEHRRAESAFRGLGLDHHEASRVRRVTQARERSQAARPC
jgi:hypothetical protein